MTGNADEPSKPVPPIAAQRQQMVDALTASERTMLLLAQSASAVIASFVGAKPDAVNPVVTEHRDRLEKRRQELLALPPEQLRSLHARQLAADQQRDQQAKQAKAAKLREQAQKKEAAKPYNQPSANADFAHWAKAAYWTLDEAVALLLGREPKALTPQIIRQELAAEPQLLLAQSDGPSPFVTQYVKLYDLAKRALEGPRLNPGAVVQWAADSGAAQPPARLIELLKPAPPVPLAPQAAEARPSPPAPATPAKATGTEKRWTEEERAELAAYRRTHGTKAAAKHFDISESRVRQLLPRKAAGHSVFTHRPK